MYLKKIGAGRKRPGDKKQNTDVQTLPGCGFPK